MISLVSACRDQDKLHRNLFDYHQSLHLFCISALASLQVLALPAYGHIPAGAINAQCTQNC
jgi:hypothetical protein